MNFTGLYNAVESAIASRPGNPRPVSFEFLRSFVTQDNSLVEVLAVLRVVYTPPIRDARFTLFDERESRYDDPEYHAEISFCASLEADPSYLLYVLVKELMHVFDPMDTWINTSDKFVQFLRDLQNTPLELNNGSINVEHKARWNGCVGALPEIGQGVHSSQSVEWCFAA